jgi:transcriptional regulator with XRE-family HTH domain
MAARWYRVRTAQDLGSALADTRRASQLTQDEAAERAETSRPTVSRAERGEPVSVVTALRLVGAGGFEVVLVPRGSRVRVDERSDD